MKKFICIFIASILLISLFSACKEKQMLEISEVISNSSSVLEAIETEPSETVNNPTPEAAGNTSNKSSAGNTENIGATTSNPTSNGANEPYNCSPINRTFTFASCNLLKNAIYNGFSKEVLENIKEIEEENENSTGAFNKFILKMKNENYLTIPYFYGKEMELDNREGYSGIAVFVYEGYYNNVPNIWFYSPGRKFYIKTIELDDSVKNEAVDKSFSWVLDQFFPHLQRTQTKNNIKHYYEDIYDKQIQLDGRTVNAMISIETKEEGGRTEVSFIYDDIIAHFVFSLGTNYEEILNGLSFVKSPLK